MLLQYTFAFYSMWDLGGHMGRILTLEYSLDLFDGQLSGFPRASPYARPGPVDRQSWLVEYTVFILGPRFGYCMSRHMLGVQLFAEE